MVGNKRIEFPTKPVPVDAGGAASAVPDNRLTVAIRIWYAGGLFGLGIAQIGISSLLMYFSTDVMGFPAATAGMLMLVGGITDCVANLLAARCSTRQWSWLGRYRPFMIYGAVPFAASFAMLFLKPDLPPAGLVAFAVVAQILYGTCFAFISVPHSGLITRLSSDAVERASLGGLKAAAGGLGALAGGYLGLGIVDWLGRGDEQIGFICFGVILGAITAFAVFMAGAGTRELVGGGTTDQDSTSFVTAVRYGGRNRALLAILSANVLFFIGYAFLFGGAVYYFKYIYLDPVHTKSAILAAGVGSIVFPPLWIAMVRRWSKTATWVTGGLLISAAFLGLYLFVGAPLWLVLIFYLCLGGGKAAVLMNYYSMTADAVDYGHWKLGARVEAYSFGFLSLSSKLGIALGGGLIGMSLSWAGFEANVALDVATLDRIRIAIFVIPAVLVAGSVVAISFFGISNARHGEIMRDLARP